jgi:hypothetical protein
LGQALKKQVGVFEMNRKHFEWFPGQSSFCIFSGRIDMSLWRNIWCSWQMSSKRRGNLSKLFSHFKNSIRIFRRSPGSALKL